MKTRTLIALCSALALIALSRAEEEQTAKGSIHVEGKVAKADRAALAKVSFDDALQAAHAALPGKVINGALEAEDGNLQYAFEILNPKTGKIDEVAIDAGNAKVLGIDRDDND